MKASERVERELIGGLQRQMQPVLVLIGASTGVGMLAWLMWEQGRRFAVAWGMAHFAVIVISTLIDGWFRRRPHSPLTSWGNLITVVSTVNAAMWGLGGYLFFDVNDVVGTALLFTWFAGINVVFVAAFSVSYRMFVCVTTSASAPLCVMSLTSGSTPFILIGVGQLAYLTLIFIAGYRHRDIVRRAAELRFENEDLAENLRQAYEAKTRFLAAASHDLRQPLHAQSLFVELLEAQVTDPAQRAFLSRIQASGRALKGLLDALLELSRIDASALKVQPTHFALGALFDELQHEVTASAQRKGLRLEVKPTTLVLHTDRELLGRVLRNLLSNAVRYTPKGTVCLEARSAGAGRATLHVADTGPGIPVAEQQKVFEAFYQVGAGDRDQAGERGLGLGLSIVRGLCDALAVPLTLASQPQRAEGTEFTLDVPLGAAEQVRAPAPEPWSPATIFTGRRVLVIDDEEHIRSATAALLASWDCEAVCAASLTEALRLAASGRIDGAVCDYRLADGVSGIDAIAALEKQLGTGMPTVFVTAETSPDRLEALRASGRALLFKPVPAGKLRAALSALLAPTTP